MKTWFLALIVALLPAMGHAQECTPANEHPPLTALDHASMLAAYTASFQGLYGHAPSMQAGSGVEDGNYWIAVSDHYGAFSDGICRAGWSAYWEAKLATNAPSASPALGDQPARFQPSSSPQPPTPPQPPVVTPPAPPLPTTITCDPAAILAAIADLKATMSDEHAQQTNVLKQIGGFIKDNLPAIAAAFGTYATCKASGKC